MSLEQVLSKLKENPRVIGAFVMKQRHRLMVEVEESRVRATGGITYENRGLENFRTKELAVCVFSRGFLESPTEIMLTLEDDEGTVCGELVPRGMREAYNDRGGVWVTDDFVVYPEVIPTSDPHFVIVPHGMSIGEEQGVKDVSAFNPAMSTDEMLKNEFGIEQSSRITSTIMTMDRLRWVYSAL